MIKYLSIESTFDDLSIAIMDDFNLKKIVTKSISSVMFEKYGGIVPFLSYKEHLNNLPNLINEFKSNDIKGIKFISYANEPGIQSNISIAKYLSISIKNFIESEFFYTCEIFGVNHIKCHLLACMINKNHSLEELDNSIFLLVTGAHTSIFNIKVLFNKKKIIFNLIDETKDIAIGSFLDKLSRDNGFLHAADMCKKIENPSIIEDISFPYMKNKSYISFSGIESHAKRINSMYLQDKENFCYSIQIKTFEYLFYRLNSIMTELNVNKVFVGGGVVRNKFFFDFVKKNNFFYSLPEFSSDNGAMIGIGGYLIYKGWEII